jgi:LacI family transcriptional regulator
VLTGRRNVSPQSARAVLAASERLGYRPNTAARSLRTRSTATVGMVVPGISNPYFPLLVEAVERRLSATGRELLLCDSQNEVGIEAARVDALLGRRVDGLLFVACDSEASAPTVARAAGQVPVVQMDRHVDGHDGDFVGVDNETGMRDVLEHLTATGRRTFAFVSSETIDSSARVRLRVFREVLGAVDAASADRVLLGQYSVEWGAEAVRRLLAMGPLPDAVVCGADIIALGAIAALAEAGVRVPADVAVTGFDDIAFAAISAPSLTTLRQPADAIGAEGVRMLEERLRGDAKPYQRRTFRPHLVVRASSAPAAPPAEGRVSAARPG